ncbi:unnamed protein product [Ectocarpus sp. 12 AP-2014]
MAEVVSIRPAVRKDAALCAGILNDWIDALDWVPRVHAHDDVTAFYQDVVFEKRDLFVAGDPVTGFVALDCEAEFVSALYVATPGQGTGKQLLDFAKRGADALELWTFQLNDGARRFYKREGFEETRTTDGDNEEGLPDVLCRWERA